MNFNKKNISRIVKVLILFFFCAHSQYSFALWQPPAEGAVAPASNALAPLHVGSGQSKLGGLSLNSEGASNGLLVEKGRVGLGTVNPSARLSVWGSGTAGGVIFNAVSSGSTTLFSIFENGKVGINTLPGAPLAHALEVNGNIKASVGFCINSSCISSWPSALSGGTASYLTKWTSASAVGSSLLYDNGTNIGIGTASPAQKLDVVGNVKASTGFCIGASCITSWPTGGAALTGGVQNYVTRWTSASTVNASSILYDNGTNVGIGTASPAQKLDVVGNVKASTGFCIGASCITNWPTGGTALSGGVANALTKWTGASTVGASSVYEISGNVGIGTASPTQKLHVVGSVQIQDGTQAVGDVLVSDSVGKGTWAPAPGTFSSVQTVSHTVGGAGVAATIDCTSLLGVGYVAISGGGWCQGSGGQAGILSGPNYAVIAGGKGGYSHVPTGTGFPRGWINQCVSGTGSVVYAVCAKVN